MSDLLTTAQDTVRDRCIEAYVSLLAFAERARDQRGQTAAEYMGVLVVVAAIITAVATTEIGDTIRQAAVNLINQIAGSGGGGGE